MSVNAAGNLPLHFKLATTEPKTMSIPPALILSLLKVNPSKPHCAQIESIMLAEDATGTPLKSSSIYWDNVKMEGVIRLDMEISKTFYIAVKTVGGGFIVLRVDLLVDKDGPTTGPVPPPTGGACSYDDFTIDYAAI